MRHLVVISLLAPALVCAQQAAPAPSSTKIAKIEELFRLTKTDQIQKELMVRMASMVKQQAGGNDEASQKIMEFVVKKMGWDSMKADFVKLYDDTYTEDEISGLLLFYQSPPGQAFLAKSPSLVNSTVSLVQMRMAELKPELDKMIKEMNTKK